MAIHYSSINSSFLATLPIVSTAADTLLFGAIQDWVSLKERFKGLKIIAWAVLKCWASFTQIKEVLVVMNQWIFDYKFFLKIFLFAYLVSILAKALSCKIKCSLLFCILSRYQSNIPWNSAYLNNIFQEIVLVFEVANMQIWILNFSSSFLFF